MIGIYPMMINFHISCHSLDTGLNYATQGLIAWLRECIHLEDLLGVGVVVVVGEEDTHHMVVEEGEGGLQAEMDRFDFVVLSIDLIHFNAASLLCKQQ